MIDKAYKAFVHPLGMKSLCDAVPLTVTYHHDGGNEHYHSESDMFHGLPIFQDPNMPDDEIHFRDRKGNLVKVKKIVGIGRG